MKEIATERDLRNRAAGDESVHEHIAHFKVDTSTTLDAEVERGRSGIPRARSGTGLYRKCLKPVHARLSDALGVGEIMATRLGRTSSSMSSRGFMNCGPISSSIRSAIDKSKKVLRRAPVPPSRLWTKKWVSKQPLDSILSSQCEAWTSDVGTVGNQSNEALSHNLEDASEEISDLEDHDGDCVHDWWARR